MGLAAVGPRFLTRTIGLLFALEPPSRRKRPFLSTGVRIATRPLARRTLRRPSVFCPTLASPMTGGFRATPEVAWQSRDVYAAAHEGPWRTPTTACASTCAPPGLRTRRPPARHTSRRAGPGADSAVKVAAGARPVQKSGSPRAGASTSACTPRCKPLEQQPSPRAGTRGPMASPQICPSAGVVLREVTSLDVLTYVVCVAPLVRLVVLELPSRRQPGFQTSALTVRGDLLQPRPPIPVPAPYPAGGWARRFRSEG